MTTPGPPGTSCCASAAGAALPPVRLRLHNPVLLSLMLAAAAAVGAGGFVAVAPNRLIAGRPVMLWECAGVPLGAAIAGLGALLVAAAFVPPRRAVHWAAAAIAAGLLLVTLAAAGAAAGSLAAAAPALARVSLGAGFWGLAAGSALALVDALARARAGGAVRLAAVVAVGLAVAAMAGSGAFDALSLVREYHTRRALFGEAILRHIALVAAAVGPAVALGFPLGLVLNRRPRLEAPLLAALNLLQTIPSIALFGLLIVPLSALAAAVPALAALGIGGIGPAPAVIALVLYSLLPVVRNTAAGIGGVDSAVVEAARGMGMTGGQLFRRVELPLALPVLFAGLRIVTVQAIGLAVIAALIGAGGLGTFVFQGLGQYDADLILLGAVPAILLALLADFLLQLLAAALGRRFAP